MLRFKYPIFTNNNNNNLRKISTKMLDDTIHKTTEQINKNKNNISLNYLPEQNNKQIQILSPKYLNSNNNNLFFLMIAFFAGYQFRYYIQRKPT